jgi:HEAT repeat protein
MGLFGASPEKIEKWTEKGNIKKLIGVLNSDDAALKRMASDAMGKIGGQDVLDYCKENSENADDKVRWHVTQILGNIGTKEAMDILSTVNDPLNKMTKRLKDKVR